MSKIRINDLARELEVKSKAILDSLPEVGITEKKTHSSSLE
jgi:translation initiation factor IF-2